jgi:phosphomevalonate kinase
LQITEDRRERVIDLYFNQHKTYAEIAGIERMSPRDINVIVKEEDARRQKYQNQQQQEMISSKAYKLFSEGKRPVEVAIALNLRELEATKYYREYWKLKQLHRLNSLYEEIGDDIRHILKLHRRAKKEGLGIEQVVKLLQLADEDKDIGLSTFEKWRKWRIDEIRGLDMQIERSKNHLQSVNDEIAGAKYSLDYCRDAYERIRQELQRLYEEKNKLESLLRENNGNIAE